MRSVREVARGSLSLGDRSPRKLVVVIVGLRRVSVPVITGSRTVLAVVVVTGSPTDSAAALAAVPNCADNSQGRNVSLIPHPRLSGFESGENFSAFPFEIQTVYRITFLTRRRPFWSRLIGLEGDLWSSYLK